MMRSLYAGVAGLKTHQTKMDVIGNNIANVNTVGYKAQSVSFSDVLYQTTQSASGPNAESGKGGTNAMQIGLGSKVAAMTTSISDTGGSQATNNPFDLMINGGGMFIVNNGVQNFFTKAGNFTTDASGNLVTSAGYSVMGWQVNEEGVIERGNVKPLNVYGPKFAYATPEQTTNAKLTGNINKEDGSFAENADGVKGTISTNISFYDNLGYEYKLTIQISQTDDYTYTMTANQLTCNGVVLDDYNLKIQDPDPNVQNTLRTAARANLDKLLATVTRDNSGNPQLAANASVDITFDDSDGSSNLVEFGIDTSAILGTGGFKDPVIVNTEKLTCFGKDTSIIPDKGDNDGLGRGRMAGKMTAVSIQTDGIIVADYDNGDSKQLGQIVVATFANLAGLQKEGQNLYSATTNSGEFDGIGQDITADGGTFSPGYVEMSNVDLSAQFTDMITTQRGFQANSRIITVSDTLLEELINLKR